MAYDDSPNPPPTPTGYVLGHPANEGAEPGPNPHFVDDGEDDPYNQEPPDPPEADDRGNI